MLSEGVMPTSRDSAPHAYRLDPEAEPASLSMDPAVLDRLAASFEQELARGALCHGAQLAVYRGGKRVLDLGAGLARVRTRERVTPDTLFVLYSSTKGLTALLFAQLFERAACHIDELAVKWWPELARVVPQKAGITLRHILSHRAGMALGPKWLGPELWADRAEIRRAMEELALRSAPGERPAYHAMNYGHLLNELAERISGRDCGALLRDEIAGPLGLRDLHLGLPDDPALEARVAWVYHDVVLNPGRASDLLGVQSDAGESPAAPPPASEPPERYGGTPEFGREFNWPETHRAVLPAAGGIATARDLAAVYAVLALGGEGRGAKLVSSDTLATFCAPVARDGEVDGTIGFPMRWASGFHLGFFGRGSTLATFGHAGAGGQVAFADPARELGFAFVCNGELDKRFLTWRYKLQSLALDACR
jgi:CubicO group peptidase (beta-lactamase class C family)